MSGGTETKQPESSTHRRSFWRRHRWILWLAGAAGAFLVALAVVLSIVARRFEPFVRAQIVEALQQHFHTHVELGEFHIRVQHGQEAQWGLWAQGSGLRIWPPNAAGAEQVLETAPDSPPLIEMGEFSFHVPLRYEMTKHLHVAELRMKNLTVTVPPRAERKQLESQAVTNTPEERASGARGALGNVTIGRVICDGASLTLETDKPGKLPLEFDIPHLKLTNIAFGKPFAFEAVVTNPKPKGVINAEGNFGPWAVEDPGESPLNGKYVFEHADLSTFNGIAGMLRSTGNYQGTLRQLAVDGEADVPDFKLTAFGNELPLHTRFHARVDGTDGDTWLEPVDATLGHSHFTTTGKVVRVAPGANASAAVMERAAGKPAAGRAVEQRISVPPEAAPGEAGHLIDLKVNVDRGNLEDFLRLVNRSSTPLVVGPLSAQASFHLPPGVQPVQMRMKLDGQFKLDDARFTDPKVQDKVEELSLRGQGHPGAMKNTDPASIHSAMEGSFHVDHGVVTLPDLKYEVPGADIEVHGDFAFDGRVKFEGTARMQATVSQMVGGWKGFLLKPVDHIFRKDGAGALIPIHIRGTRDAPQIGVDFNRLKETSPEKPGEKDQTHPEKPGDKDETHPEKPQ